jgi:hypothetical protein
VPLRHGCSGGSNVALIVGELEADLAEIMHLPIGQLLHRKDRRAVEQSEQSMPLAIELHERLGHAQLAATSIGGESRGSIQGEQLGVLGVPESSHPLRGAAMVVDAVEVTRHRPIDHDLRVMAQPGRSGSIR